MNEQTLQHFIDTDIYGLLDETPRESRWQLMTQSEGYPPYLGGTLFRSLTSALKAKAKAQRNGLHVWITRYVRDINGEWILQAYEQHKV